MADRYMAKKHVYFHRSSVCKPTPVYLEYVHCHNFYFPADVYCYLLPLLRDEWRAFQHAHCWAQDLVLSCAHCSPHFAPRIHRNILLFCGSDLCNTYINKQHSRSTSLHVCVDSYLAVDMGFVQVLHSIDHQDYPRAHDLPVERTKK